jgi:predicted phage terminase large subunit-like protein
MNNVKLSNAALEALSKEAIQIAAAQIAAERLAGSDELEQRAQARKHLLPFTTYTKPEYDVNWHHSAIANVLNDVVRGLLPASDPDYLYNAPKRVILCAPPQTGKSELVSRRLPAYAFGRIPDLTVIGTSYGADLASLMNRDIQRVISDDKYRHVFPNTRLNDVNIRSTSQGQYLRNSDIFEIVNYSGRYRSAGVGGGITGMGMRLGIIDDPFKDQMEAQSETIRNNVWEWYTTTFYTRNGKNGAIVIMHTRWHEDDLVGRLLELQKNDPNADKWLVLSFPAILDDETQRSNLDHREFGEALWSNKYDLDALAKMKANDPDGFEALQQQRPTKPGGSLLPRICFQIIEGFQYFSDMVLIRYWDKAGTEGSGAYTAGVLMCYDPQRRFGVSFIIIDVQRVQFEAYAREKLIRQTAILDSQQFRNSVSVWLEQEPGSGGKESAANTVLNTLMGFAAFSETVSNQGDKQIRAHPLSIQVKASNVGLVAGTWNEAYLQEAEKFPRGKYKDQIDASSGAFNKLAITLEELQSYTLVDDEESELGYAISPY